LKNKILPERYFRTLNIQKMKNEQYLKTVTGIFLSLIFVIISSLQVHSQWVKTGGPEGGELTTIVSNGAYAYAGGYGGLFISQNGGSGWTSLYSNLPPNVFVYSIAFSGNAILIGTHDQGIYRSTNNGVLWQAANNGIPQDAWVYSIHPSSGGIYAGLFSNNTFSRIYFSTDNGNTWIDKSAGLPQSLLIITSFAETGSRIFASTTTGSLMTGLGIYMTSDNGSNWSQVNSGLTNLYVRSLLVYQGNLYAGTAGGVFMSTNLGSSWQLMSTGLPVDAHVRSLIANGNVLYAGLDNGVYKSTNNGVSWVQINTGLLNTDVSTLAVINGNIAAGTVDGAFLSGNGVSWQPSGSGLINTYPITVAVSGSNLLAGLYSCGGMALSPNWGTSWLRSNNGLTDDSIRATIVRGSNVFIGTNYAGAFRSTNNGLSWFPINTGLPQNTGVNAFARSSDNIYASTGTQVFVSSNNGADWSLRSNGINSSIIECLAARENYIYAGTYQSGIFRSADYGMNWTQASGFISDFIVSLLTKGNYVFAGTINGGVYFSSDNGLSWVTSNSGFPGNNLNVRSLLRYSNYVIAGTDSGIFISSNNGANWIDVSSGLTSTVINSLSTNGAGIFAGTFSQGVWKRPVWEILPTHTVSGQIKYNDNNQPVNSGKVKALKYDEVTENIYVVDSAQIQIGGFYTLPHVPMDSIFIMAYPNDEFDFVPTYYPSTIDWQEASLVYPAENLSNINVAVYRINNQPGQYHVSGIVYKYANNSYTIDNGLIYAKSGNDFKNFGISGNSGSYTVSNLSPGTYTLTCYRIGYNSASTTVNITSSNLESVDFHLTNYLIGVNPPDPNIPAVFSLSQNYPNPFNPVTRINYDIPKNSLVKVVIYDILGREVKRLVDNEFKQPGRYSVEFNGTNLASGIYFYRIEANEYVKAKKMVLVK
jgi:photosystem II stability/assembly factor-like uncharacterized protein